MRFYCVFVFFIRTSCSLQMYIKSAIGAVIEVASQVITILHAGHFIMSQLCKKSLLGRNIYIVNCNFNKSWFLKLCFVIFYLYTHCLLIALHQF
jgi:hypothetical protein